jgi:tRNA A-37 threonylcarbamoyl transferase component Bud32
MQTITSTLDWESLAERGNCTAVGRANERYLMLVLSGLGPEALVEVAGLRFSQRSDSKVRVQALSRPGVHPVGVVHITNGLVDTCMFAKVQRTDYRGGQNLERELRFLSDVAPLITAENPALRCPNPIAYYPERGLLLMEFVPGDSLKRHLFEIKFGIKPTGRLNLAQLLSCTGQWLGSMHRLTAQSECGNPLEWLLQEFESTRTRDVFLRYSQKGNYDEMLSILRRCLDLKPNFRRNLCRLHGEFTPIHVMVANDAIYVVDFGNSKLGYAYEDVGLFAGFYDLLLPWRVAAGALRIKLDRQKELFLNGYFEQASSAFRPADTAIMRWVRLISFARMLNAGNGGERKYTGWGRWAYSRLALRMLRDNFTAVCRTELTALREMRVDIFDEPQAEQVSRSEACGRPVRSTSLASGSGDATHAECDGTAFLR